jgi:hypothetical protein
MPLAADSQLGVALASARTYLNDDIGAVWTNAALTPKIQDAHRELQTMLWEVGSPVVRAQSNPVNIAAGGLVVPVPADMLTPFRLVEYDTATGSLSVATDMTEKYFLPIGVIQQPTLIYWSWQQETISLIGATTNRTVVIYYRRLIPIPAVSTDPIGILFGELYLGPRAAAIAHGSLGNKDAYTIVTGFADANFKRVVAAQRGQQTPQMRP